MFLLMNELDNGWMYGQLIGKVLGSGQDGDETVYREHRAPGGFAIHFVY